MIDDFGDYRVARPNRIARQKHAERPKQVVTHKLMGEPEWEREEPRKRRDLETALITKQARGKGLPKRKR